MTVNHKVLRTAAALVLALYVSLLNFGCHPQRARDQALSTTLAALNAARDGFLAWERVHVEQLAQTGTPREAQAALDAYKRRSERCTQAMVVAYTALGAATLDPSDAMLLEAAKAVRAFYDLVRDVTGGGAP